MSPSPPERLSLGRRRSLFFLAGGGLLWGLAVFLWLQGGIDKAIQIAHEPLRHVALLMDGALAVSRYGMTACILAYLGLILSSLGPRGPKDLQRLFLPVVLLFGLAGAAGDLSKPAFDRPRPFAEHPSELSSVIAPSSSSLPSGHATKSFALVLPFVVLAGDGVRRRRALRWALAGTAAAIAYTRILLGVHYPADVLAGAGTALLFLPLVAALVDAAYRRWAVRGARMDGLARLCGVLFLVMIFYLIRFS